MADQKWRGIMLEWRALRTAEMEIVAPSSVALLTNPSVWPQEPPTADKLQPLTIIAETSLCVSRIEKKRSESRNKHTLE